MLFTWHQSRYQMLNKLKDTFSICKTVLLLLFAVAPSPWPNSDNITFPKNTYSLIQPQPEPSTPVSWLTDCANKCQASWWIAPAPPQRKSIEVMGRDGMLEHLHMAVCLGKVEIGEGGGMRGGQRECCQPSVCRGALPSVSPLLWQASKRHTMCPN